MPKPRSIDPLFWDDEDITSLSRDERLMIVGLVTVFADDEGRFPADANAIRKRLFADDRDITTDIVSGWLSHIAGKWKNFKLYAVRDKTYGWFASWERWQPMKYKAKSKLPQFFTAEEIRPNSPKMAQLGTVKENYPNLATGRDGSDGTVELSRVEFGSDGTEGETEDQKPLAAVVTMQPKEPTAMSTSQWPETAESVLMYFPASDPEIILKIAMVAVTASPRIDDAGVAEAINAVYTSGQRGPAMFLTTVPAWLAKRNLVASARGDPGKQITRKQIEAQKNSEGWDRVL